MLDVILVVVKWRSCKTCNQLWSVRCGSWSGPSSGTSVKAVETDGHLMWFLERSRAVKDLWNMYVYLLDVISGIVQCTGRAVEDIWPYIKFLKWSIDEMWNLE